jgi:hypothetical protein
VCAAVEGTLILRVDESSGYMASMVIVGLAKWEINGKRCGGPINYKRNLTYMSAQDFGRVVTCVKLLTKLMLILGLGRCSFCQMKIYIHCCNLTINFPFSYPHNYH